MSKPVDLDRVLIDLAVLARWEATGEVMDDDDWRWIGKRLEIRTRHGDICHDRCDGCGFIGDVTVLVTEYPDDMGAPSNLGMTFECPDCILLWH